MYKIYNNQKDFAIDIQKFLKKVSPNIRKTQLKIIPFIMLGMILSESCVASDIAKQLKSNFSLVQHESVIRRIKRFFSNKLFNPYVFYDAVIKYVISNYKKKHSDKRVHITFDHMFSHDNYTVFMITMRIGKQGIPLWFRCFKGKNDEHAFDEQLLKDGITYVSKLFGKEYDLVFLADRWFNSTTLLEHINSLGHKYCIRFKGNIKVLIYDKKEKHKIWKSLDNIKAYRYHASLYKDIPITENQYKVNIAISQSHGVEKPWIIITNGDPKRAIKDYGYRFGSIECMFKSQKSNGLYLESTVKANIKYFESMYGIACFTTLFLTIFGADYTKNTKCYKNVKLTTHKYIKGVKKRVMSLFNIGLTLFHLAYNSPKYIRIPYSFTLYDI